MSRRNFQSAFPVNPANLGGAGAYQAEPGMTLRDYFAGQVLVNLRVGPPALMAENAYAVADAMMAEREKVLRNG